MQTITLTQDQYNELVSKAAKWDALYDKIDAIYSNESNEADLLDIGEIAATATGHL